jgi:hypothetical protein
VFQNALMQMESRVQGNTHVKAFLLSVYSLNNHGKLACESIYTAGDSVITATCADTKDM